MAIFAKYLYLIDGDQTPMHTNNDPSDEDLESCNQGLLTIIRVGALDSTPHTYFDDEWHPVTERTGMIRIRNLKRPWLWRSTLTWIPKLKWYWKEH